MSLAENLLQTLAETQTDEDTTTLVIDNYLRTIHIPKGITNLGVEYDDEVLLLNFRMPRYLDKTDLSTFPIRINYLNQKGESDVYDVPSPVIGSDYIKFSWLVGPTATAYKGKTKFNVCLKECNSEGYVLREYNTTVASLPVLEGLEADPGVVSGYSDILEQWRQQLFGVGATEEGKITETSEFEQQKIVNKGAEVLATIPADYTETSIVADDAIRTKGDAIVCTADGEAIAATDSSDDYLRDLKLFGKTAQVTTTGKNLLSSGENGTYTSNGFTIVKKDGLFSISGKSTASAACAIHFFGEATMSLQPFEIGKTYTYSVSDVTGTIAELYFQVNYTDTNGKEYALALIGSTEYTKTFIVPEGFAKVNNVYIGWKYTASPSTLSCSFRLQIEEGDSATAWEPYSGGFASPSPDWPQELDSVDAPTVDLYGKNLIQNTLPTATICGITYTRNDDGSITLNGTATDNSYYAFDFNNKIPAHNTEMVLSMKGGAGLTSISLGYFREDGSVCNAIVYAENNTVNFKYPSDAARTRTFLTVTTGKTCNNLTVYPMVRLAGTDDTFEGDKSVQSITTAHTIPGIPVSKNGNHIDSNGQQWVCDEIDYERGVYIQRLTSITFNGTEDWYVSAAQIDSGTRFDCNISTAPVALRTDCLCDRFRYRGVNAFVETAWVLENSYGFRIITEKASTAAELQAFLAENPTTMIYVLHTPIETPLTADEIEAFKALHSNCHTTTVLNDAGVHMELKYNADTKTYVDNNIKSCVTDVMEAIRYGSY